MHPYNFALSFRIKHPTASSSDLVAVIRKKTSVKWDVGTDAVTPKGNPLGYVRGDTYCCFDVAEGPHTALVRAIERWNEHLLKRRSALAAIKRTGGKFDYFLAIYVNGNAGLNLPPKVLQDMGKLNITLGLDMYGFPSTISKKARRKR